jgi:hypothetical protein
VPGAVTPTYVRDYASLGDFLDGSVLRTEVKDLLKDQCTDLVTLAECIEASLVSMGQRKTSFPEEFKIYVPELTKNMHCMQLLSRAKTKPHTA